jgi:peroxiredoxin
MMRQFGWLACVLVGMVFTGCQRDAPAPVAKAIAQSSKIMAESRASEPKLVTLAKAPSAKTLEKSQETPKTATVTAEKETPRQKAPQNRTVFFRAGAKPASIPPVLLSKQEEALCRVKVGDRMPATALPKLGAKGETKLAEMYGKKATVVVFWKSDRRMAREELADLGPEIVEPFGKADVAVVGIAVNETVSSAQDAMTKTGATLTNLLDADGKAFSQVGEKKLPRTYVLDPDGKILWFDIEYSLTTRRELHQVLRVVTGKAASDSVARQE